MPKTPTKPLIASMIGNVVQWYNYAIIAALIPFFLKLFLPANSPLIAPVLFFLIYSAPLITRPLGGLCLGNFSDAFGRKPAIILTISLMAISMMILSLLPGYQTVGFIAPALLILTILIHGFASGGEFPTITTFAMEISPSDQKVFCGSWIFFGIFTGMMLSQGLLMVCTLNLSTPHFASFGWRLLVLFGGLLGLLGFFVRNRLKETPSFLKIAGKQHILRSELLQKLKKNKKQLFLAFGLGILDGCIFNLYLTTSFWNSSKHSMAELSTLHFFTILCALGICLLFGKIAQKIGGIKTQMIAIALLLIAVYPLTITLFSGTMNESLIASIIMGLIVTLYLAPMPAVMASLFPTEIRSTCIAISYSVAVAIAGSGGFMLLSHFVTPEKFFGAAILYVSICALMGLGSLVVLQNQKKKFLV